MTDTSDDVLLVEEHGAVRLLTLNRPDAFNATNEVLHGALANVLELDDGLFVVLSEDLHALLPVAGCWLSLEVLRSPVGGAATGSAHT